MAEPFDRERQRSPTAAATARWARAAERLRRRRRRPKGPRCSTTRPIASRRTFTTGALLAVAARWPDQPKRSSRSPSARPTTPSSSCAPRRRPPRRSRCSPTSPTTPACRCGGAGGRPALVAPARAWAARRAVGVRALDGGVYLEQQDDTASASSPAKADEASVMFLDGDPSGVEDGGLSTPLVTELKYAQSTRFLDPTPWWLRRQAEEFAYVQAPATSLRPLPRRVDALPDLGYTYFLPQPSPSSRADRHGRARAARRR